jgi:hypothetical protein
MRYVRSNCCQASAMHEFSLLLLSSRLQHIVLRTTMMEMQWLSVSTKPKAEKKAKPISAYKAVARQNKAIVTVCLLSWRLRLHCVALQNAAKETSTFGGANIIHSKDPDVVKCGLPQTTYGGRSGCPASCMPSCREATGMGACREAQEQRGPLQGR